MNESNPSISVRIETQLAGHKNFRRLLALFNVQLRSKEPEMRIPILLHGPKGIGKSLLASLYSRAVYCPSRGTDGEPCFVCETCKNFHQQRPLGYTHLSIRGDGFREKLTAIADQADQASLGDEHVIVIEHIDAIDQVALDVLLKPLEMTRESRPTFIFTADNVEDVRRTIRSRSIEFPVKPLTGAECEQLVAERGKEAAHIDLSGLGTFIIRASDGFMGRLLDMLDDASSQTPVSQQSVLTVCGLDWPSRLAPAWPVDVAGGMAKQVAEALLTNSVTEAIERVQLLLIFVYQRMRGMARGSQGIGNTVFSLQDASVQDKIYGNFLAFAQMENMTPMQLWEHCSRRWSKS